MEQNFKIAVPEGCTADIKQENGFLVVTFEPKEWEPKDGDFIAYSFKSNNLNIGIFREQCEPGPYDLHKDYVTIGGNSGELIWGDETFIHDYMRPATEEEKQRLFDALAKEGKRWNAEEKRIEDLPRWRANPAEFYFYIDDDFSIGSHSDIRDGADESYYKSGNYFKTREAAEKVADQIREIFKNSEAE